jgi:K+-transporting ATPase ATPase C chain
MKKLWISNLALTSSTIVIFGLLYPLFITGIAILIAPAQGNGETIVVKGKIVGFELIGQKFDDDRYFHSRPSAVDYNAAATGGSNKGPSNPEYLLQVQAHIDTILAHNPGIQKKDIPVDLITASGSGIDPHISIQSARLQVKRIAQLRHLPESKLNALITEFSEGPIWGCMGPSRVHVLKLNIALDKLSSL